ncbi:MAG: MaoC family dehydratase [Gemmatimonadaceae bacterium]|nr:MaoC family dehydratase [Gemmatimonadaceae bacterium]
MPAHTDAGRFFEDFQPGETLVHAVPRTVTEGDASLYLALYGVRSAVTSSTPFAQSLGLQRAPIDPMLVFHLVFGKTVADISLNAIANLGYAECRWGAPVYPGDTLTTTSEVLGVKENRDAQTGVVYVRSTGMNQFGDKVLQYARWVMVRKRNPKSPAPRPVVPTLADHVPVSGLVVPWRGDRTGYDDALAGSTHRWDDYRQGDRIDHVDGMTIEEADHMLATRLYQNTAKVHFNAMAERAGRFGRRIVYGGHVISLARHLSFNGLANALGPVAIHGGRHVAPCFAGDTVHAWSEVLEATPLPGRDDLGVLRLRTVATRDRTCGDFPFKGDDGAYDPSVVLDLDYSVAMVRR